MANFLLLDTALKNASVAVAKNCEIVAIEENNNQMQHEQWLHLAIKNILEKPSISFSQLDAVAITIGPGSYTGLRVGLAATKGICFATEVPLIAINTLEMMASAALKANKTISRICPMIDARRMEIFVAMYDNMMNELMTPQPMLIDEKSFEEELKEHNILFFGDGANKFLQIVKSKNAIFSEVKFNATDLLPIAIKKFEEKNFADIVFSEPQYLKEFYTTMKINES